MPWEGDTQVLNLDKEATEFVKLAPCQEPVSSQQIPWTDSSGKDQNNYLVERMGNSKIR